MASTNNNNAATSNTSPSSGGGSVPAAATAPPVLSGSMNWEPVRKRLLSPSDNLDEALKAATELRENIEIVHTTEFPLMLSALLPAFSSVLSHRTRPNRDTSSTEQKLRSTILDIISKMPPNEVLRPHAPYLVALAMDILNRDFEENALLASRIIFDLYKVYRSLPQDYVQPYLDFVVSAYRALPTAVQRNFSPSSLSSSSPSTTTKTDVTSSSSSGTKAAALDQSPEEPKNKKQKQDEEKSSSKTTAADAPLPSPSSTASAGGEQKQQQPGPIVSSTASITSATSQPSSPSRLALRSNLSFRVLTESPLIVMLMLQLYPSFLKNNVPILINVMMEALGLRSPPLQSVIASANAASSNAPVPAASSGTGGGGGKQQQQPPKIDSHVTRLYFSRARELVAAQAKTLSFVTYLLRSYSNELKPYEERLATNVVTLMTICPRESISTRKELLVALRHLLNSDFRKGFFRHVDAFLDERVLIGSSQPHHQSFSDQALLRPLGYTTLSDLVQHVRSLLTMSQMSRVVSMLSRVLHDSSLPMSTQYTAVRTLLSVVEVIYHNKDPNPQIGRDLLVQTLKTLVHKLAALVEYFPTVQRESKERVMAAEKANNAKKKAKENNGSEEKDLSLSSRLSSPSSAAALSGAPPDTVRDLQIMIRAIIVGHKTLIYYLNSYRNQREKDKTNQQKAPVVVGLNDEVSSAMSRLTHTEIAIIDEYILTALPASKLLKEKSTSAGRHSNEKPQSEQHRDALTYFAAAFTTLDGINLARTLGRHLDLLVDAIVEDPMVMVVPRHILGANAMASFEFCTLLLDHLVGRMDELAFPRDSSVVFFDAPASCVVSDREAVTKKLATISQLPKESDEQKKQRSTTLLHLFERVLKSLSAFPDNESIVRRHLLKIVVVCLRSSMEEIDAWPDNYCMLLRYVFRSISAGKFEESYKELLPLIPTVLNGLYRIISTSGNMVLRHTAVELCLTIPARLSSLLPHMNLLLRVIIPALESNSGDLVNLGLRTLEFWIDNLNPVFLYPEMSKQIDFFTSMMQALSRHLRPAPYPYGLLTLRLLGKLGGKNRLFLREPLLVFNPTINAIEQDSKISINCSWNMTEANTSSNATKATITLPLPLDRSISVLKTIALARTPGTLEAIQQDVTNQTTEVGTKEKIVLTWDDSSKLWTENLLCINFSEYSKSVMEKTKESQAKACMSVLSSAAGQLLCEQNAGATEELKMVYLGMLYGSMIAVTKDDALALRKKFAALQTAGSNAALGESLVEFFAEPSAAATAVGLDFLHSIAQGGDAESIQIQDDLLSSLCSRCASCNWSNRSGLQEAICCLVKELGQERSWKHEVEIINTALVCIKSVPRELSNSLAKTIKFFVMVCSSLYGPLCPVSQDNSSSAPPMIWDILGSSKETKGSARSHNQAPESEEKEIEKEQSEPHKKPSTEVFRLLLSEMVSPEQSVRFAARFLLMNYIITRSSQEAVDSLFSGQLSLIKRVLFSRSLRLIPLMQQVGIIEGLAVLLQEVPSLFPLTDQHLLSFLSELLKICSVGDGEMTESSLKDYVVDKNGYVNASGNTDPSRPTHASALFFHRVCVIAVEGAAVVLPEELPAGVQLRVSAIRLLHSTICSYSDPFFDAEITSPVGNIRPHVISLLFRSLASEPPKAVEYAHNALQDVLSLSMISKTDSSGATKSQSRLPKELLQTCIRPVLLNLRDYTRLSIPLLRGLSRLLSLLSSWFNRTLGEKLLDHLQKWLDPGKIISQKIWKEGEEPLVAAAIVDIFALLPHASHFVDSLVKTCIKLDVALPAYKTRLPESPFLRPLARYLNRHTQYAVSFFFQRLKTPMYSELFQNLIRLDESISLRSYLSDKQCSVMILNFCFEKPLAIIRSEKNSSSSGSSKGSLYVHGVGKKPADLGSDGSSPKPINVESLELQLQGFSLVQTLLENDPSYFNNHNDIVRAFRWLWRSKGRFLRLQHEDALSPRFHRESKLLACFLMSYGKSFYNEDLDILFELIRIFVQPSSTDFSFVGQYLNNMVTYVLNTEQKKQVMQRFFSLLSGESSEETKVLSIQYLILPMLSYHFSSTGNPSLSQSAGSKGASPEGSEVSLVDKSVLEKFVKDVLFPRNNLVNCGDRLKVELLKLSNLFVIHAKKTVEPVRKEIVKFCWGLLKSEDTACKGWAYLVVSRFIVAFDTPEKIVMQVYGALLRLHQTEGKELVREALDVLIPSLQKKLSEEELQKAIDQATKMMLEDSNSTPQLAHICQMMVQNPSVFYSSRNRFANYMLSSLNRLGLPPNSPTENRALAINIVELLLSWERQEGSNEPKLLTVGQADSMANFLVRLKILMAEPNDGRVRVDTGTQSLDNKITELLASILSNWNCTIREQPFEKVMSNNRKPPGLLTSCVDILLVLVKAKQHAFFEDNHSVLKDLIALCFKLAKEDSRLRKQLKLLISQASEIPPLASSALVSLERVIVDVTMELKKNSLHRGGETSSRQSRSRIRATASDSNIEFALFAVELIVELYSKEKDNLNLVADSLLTLAGVLAKNHLLDAAAKQRNGSSLPPRIASSGIRFHTPSGGILEATCFCDPVEFCRPPQVKSRTTRDDHDLTPNLQTLLNILFIFESSDIVYHFTQNRKMLLQILGSILDTSDCLELLLIATRTVSKWLLETDPGIPLTKKERNSFLLKLALFDYSCLPDDATAQPLADIIAIISEQLLANYQNAKEDEDEWVLTRRLCMACLLNSNVGTRESIISQYLNGNDTSLSGGYALELVMKLLKSDFEGLGGRYWIAVLVDTLLQVASCAETECIASIRVLAHGDVNACQRLLEFLLPIFWKSMPEDSSRLSLISTIESLLSQPFHTQFLRDGASEPCGLQSMNSVRSLVNVLTSFNPAPILDSHLLVYLAENYNCWHEALLQLEHQHLAFSGKSLGDSALSAMRRCYRLLGEQNIWLSLSGMSCKLPPTTRAISYDLYGMAVEASDSYTELVELTGTETTDKGSSMEPSDFEMDMWEERWVQLQRDLCQQEVVKDFASVSGNPYLSLECAWKSQDWSKVRTLCSSASLLPAIESGDPVVKITETLLAVADGKLSDVENLHAQTAQLCLYKWQLLPILASGSPSHSVLLHFFHRLVEIRESGQIMVETSNHSNGRTLPDLKNLLNAWRHRLPNNFEPMSTWDEIFAWRAYMFSTITTNFQSFCEPNTLATLHDRPWTAIRMAKTARKQGLRGVSLLLLNNAVEERAMNVSDAFLKLREQILTYYNPDSDLERHGGLNLINTTNLSFFDASQKSELFRLKAMFLASLGGRSKANQAYCHSVQICPSYSRAWESWGGLCSSLGAVAEKQLEQTASKSDSSADMSKDPKATSKKVAQYLAQAMGCYLEAVHIDTNEWARIFLPKCLYMLVKDGSSPGVLCQTLEKRGSQLPPWVWLPWIPQLLTSLYRHEGRAIKTILTGIAKAYPQALYYSLRAFYLERRDVERAKGSSPSSGQHMNSVLYAEEMMSLLRRSHASLWSALEAILEELIVRFRPLPEEELLSPIVALLERAEVQLGNNVKQDEEESVAASIWKTIQRIASKFFRPSEPTTSNRRDDRAKKTALFKETYRGAFEADFHVSSSESSGTPTAGEGKVPLTLEEFVDKLRDWKLKLEKQVFSNRPSSPLIESSHALAVFAVADAPDLWPGSCDTRYCTARAHDNDSPMGDESGTNPSSTTSSAAAARKAAVAAATATTAAATTEGVGGDYGGGSAYIEVPGQYVPNTSSWADGRPNPELHPKLMRFEHSVQILHRGDQLVRRLGMVGSDGKTHYFLVQAAVPYWTRTDERTMQTLYVLDKILRRGISSSRLHLSVQPHSVVPMAQRLRLIGEPNSRTSLEDVYREACIKAGQDPAALCTQFTNEVKKTTSSRKLYGGKDKEDETSEEKAQRLKVYENIKLATKANSSILLKHIYSLAGSPEPLFQLRRTFSHQWASNCLLQYGFSVAERTPPRVALLTCNGRVLSPEFRIVYSSQGFTDPPQLPFRMTDNLSNLIGFPLMESHFIPAMSTVAGAIRESKQEITPILRLLSRDDLIAYYTRSMPKSDSKTQEMEKQLADRNVKNVSAILGRIGECTPKPRKGDAEKNEEGPIDDNVRQLVETARKPENLCMMPSSYQAWL